MNNHKKKPLNTTLASVCFALSLLPRYLPVSPAAGSGLALQMYSQMSARGDGNKEMRQHVNVDDLEKWRKTTNAFRCFWAWCTNSGTHEFIGIHEGIFAEIRFEIWCFTLGRQDFSGLFQHISETKGWAMSSISPLPCLLDWTGGMDRAYFASDQVILHAVLSHVQRLLLGHRLWSGCNSSGSKLALSHDKKHARRRKRKNLEDSGEHFSLHFQVQPFSFFRVFFMCSFPWLRKKSLLLWRCASEVHLNPQKTPQKPGVLLVAKDISLCFSFKSLSPCAILGRCHSRNCRDCTDLIGFLSFTSDAQCTDQVLLRRWQAVRSVFGFALGRARCVCFDALELWQTFSLARNQLGDWWGEGRSAADSR